MTRHPQGDTGRRVSWPSVRRAGLNGAGFACRIRLSWMCSWCGARNAMWLKECGKCGYPR